MKDIIENATIEYKNGVKKIFEAVTITEKGVYVGAIRSNNEEKKFVYNSFIPLDQIKNIITCNEKGKIKNII
jgi:hypothetical protein